jgi:hypothetical protein
MSIRIYVEAYSGYKANERPIRFYVDEDTYEISAIQDLWQDPNATYYKVRTTEQKIYLLRYDQSEDKWTLQSGFDGEELLVRPGIDVVPVDPQTIQTAISKVVACEHCHEEYASLPFDSIIKLVTGRLGRCDFMMSELARCPNCRGMIDEKTFVQPQSETGIGSL